MKSKILKRHAWPVALAGLVALAGCASGPAPRGEPVDEEELRSFLADKPAPYHAYYQVTLQQGERNAVLNYLRIGLELLKRGELRHSARAFDQAIDRIRTIYADNDAARKARSKFTPEYVKEFKGDPYERAMAFFYRGLLFLEQDDYENARAAMLAGLEQDAMAEDADYAKDFALLYYLAGWASHCDGDRDLAMDYFFEAYRLNGDLQPPKRNHDLLYLAFVNTSPVKQRTGEYKEKLFYTRSWPAGRSEKTRDYAIDLMVGTRYVPLVLAEDVFYQAATRGGRAVDVINAGKAEFKESTEELGTALTGSGLAAMNAAAMNPNSDYSNNMANAGAAMAILGLISSITSAQTKPEADVRYWDNLPEFVYLATGEKAPDGNLVRKDRLQATLFNASGRPVPGYVRVKPYTYGNRVTRDRSCDWLGVEAYKRPLPTAHVNP